MKDPLYRQIDIWLIADIFPNTTSTQIRSHPGMQEWESQESIDILIQTIKSLGYSVDLILNPKEFIKKFTLLEHTKKQNTILWNLVEGYGSRNREAYIPAIAEYFGVSCIGSDAHANILNINKYLCTQIAKSISIPIPIEIRIRCLEDLKKMETFFDSKADVFFVKPNLEGSSMGIFENSICYSVEEVKERSIKLLDSYDELLIQEYLPGDEFSVALLQTTEEDWLLGSAQIIPPGKVYDSKTKSKSSMPESVIKISNQNIRNFLENKSLKFVKELRCEGYARVDWKMDSLNQLKFLEINTTPGLSKVYSLFPKILELSTHLEYTTMIQKIIENAVGQFHISNRYQYGKSFL
ncbi:MAG: hypothetical protein CK427_15750 [Leptospira sp.]|nr:MAG: hypothetical protein CK427_15750 [Leptospira sp.]